MTKIEALEKTIYNLENDVYEYNWVDCETCNCGILARTIFGDNLTGRSDVPRNEDDFPTPWAGYSVCLTTGIRLPAVWEALKNSGFTHQDIVGLESLSNEKILNKIGKERCCNRWHKPDVIKYLKAWVEILKEEKLNSEPLAQECDARKAEQGTKAGSIKTVIKYVSVPETIHESLPETILS